MANRKRDGNVTFGDFPQHGGGSSGGGDMFEARIAKLEAIAEHTASDVTDIKSDAKIMLSDLSVMKTDIALIKRDGDSLRAELKQSSDSLRGELKRSSDELRSETAALRLDVSNLTKRMVAVEGTISSFTLTIKVGVAIVSAAIVAFGFIAGPYLAKIVSILNSMAIQS